MATSKQSGSKKGGTKETKSGGTKAQGEKTGGRGTANEGFMKPVQPDSELAAIVGNQPLPRTEITKKVWDYIKSNNLQDANDKRTINADAKLGAVFGGKKQVTMFEMTKLVNQHVK